MTDKDLMRRFAKILFATVWLVCIYGLVESINSTQHFLRVARKAPGVVVALNAGGSHPQIEFKDGYGKAVSYAQGGLITGYKIGDKVIVLYREDTSNPRATVDRFGAVWELSIYFSAMVVLIPVIGLVNILISRFNERRKADRWKITD